jgi:hypothetical protein
MHAEPLARMTRKKICIEPGLAEFLCKETRTKVPDFTLDAVSLTPWIAGEEKYVLQINQFPITNQVQALLAGARTRNLG